MNETKEVTIEVAWTETIKASREFTVPEWVVKDLESEKSMEYLENLICNVDESTIMQYDVTDREIWIAG